MMKPSGFFLGITGAAFCFSFQQSVLAKTWYVDASVGASGDGTSRETALKTVGEAISAAANGDNIVVKQGVHNEAINFRGKRIALESRNPLDPNVVGATVLDASGLDCTVVTFKSRENGGSVIAGFTITGGKAQLGGGIYCDGASPAICNNIIRDNQADMGGGVYFCGDTSARFIGNEVKENAAIEGGGIYCIGKSPVIENNRICLNRAEKDAGGIHSHSPDAVIRGNLIQANSAQQSGGGIKVGCGAQTLSNNTIVGNRAVEAGGAVFVYSTATLINHTIVGNEADFVGGVCPYGYNSAALLINCIVWDNGMDLWRCGLSYCCVENFFCPLDAQKLGRREG